MVAPGGKGVWLFLGLPYMGMQGPFGAWERRNHCSILVLSATDENTSRKYSRRVCGETPSPSKDEQMKVGKTLA